MKVLLNPAQIAENVLMRCKQINIGAKDFCKSIGIGINTVYHMTAGSYPRVDTMHKIASGLGCTIDELCTVDEEENGGEDA